MIPKPNNHEIELLLADVAEKNPMGVKRLAEDPDLKKKQLDSLKQIMAFAVQAQKEGYTSDPTNHQELENIRAQIEATLYDQEINKDKGPMPPFGFITEEQVNQYWGEDQNPQARLWPVFPRLDRLEPALEQLRTGVSDPTGAQLGHRPDAAARRPAKIPEPTGHGACASVRAGGKSG